MFQARGLKVSLMVENSCYVIKIGIVNDFGSGLV
jgi:hypothetical protein